MILTITCLHCGREVPRNPRMKKQSFVHHGHVRMLVETQPIRQEPKKSSGCRSLRKARNKSWRDNYPAHEYQKEYRKNHPEYVKHNRELQKERNNDHKPEPPKIIVKTYALSPQLLQDGLYRGFEVKDGKIVKTYALIAQMHALSVNGSHFTSKPV